MNRIHDPRWLAVLAVGVLLTALIGVSGPLAGDAAAQDDLTCRWKSLGQSTLARYHEAGAFDTNANQFFYYGGLDATLQTQDDLGMLDLSDPDLDAARHRTIPVSALRRFGASAAFRSAEAEPALYFFGGADDAASGQGTDDVQKLKVDDLTWTKPSPASGTFESRLFSAAAYDPEHDVIVITGGVKSCGTDDLPCTADTYGTLLVTFDDTGAMAFEDGPDGGPTTLFGHTMVYDSVAKRMLAFGGARTSEQAANALYALDLSDPDIANASWSELTVQGGPTGLALHGAAFDAPRNWLVVYGGATANLFEAGGESASGATYALDLAAATLAWQNLGASFGERVGGVMAYDPVHEVSVFHAGRRAATSSDASDAFRDSQALVCEGQPGPSVTPGGPTETQVPPTQTEVPPTETEVPPTETEVPPTETEVPPTETEVPPTETEAPPTETQVPPTETEEPPTTPPPGTTEAPTEAPTETPPPTNTDVPTATETPPPATTESPTDTPSTPATPSGSPTPTLAVGRVCEFILDRVPAQVINSAVTNPDTVAGWDQLCDPNKPPSRFNYPRTWLSIQHVGRPYHPIYNSLAWKCGCP